MAKGRKTLSQAQILELRNVTDKVYRDAVYKLYGPYLLTWNLFNAIPTSMLRRQLEINGCPYDADAVDEEYRKTFCTLPTETLELVILGASNNQFRRAQSTIDTILAELLERELNSQNRTYNDEDEKASQTTERSGSQASDAPGNAGASSKRVRKKPAKRHDGNDGGVKRPRTRRKSDR